MAVQSEVEGFATVTPELNVHVDCENDHRLVFLEYWSDADALKMHFSVPASLEFVRAVRELATGAVEMTIFDSHPWPAS